MEGVRRNMEMGVSRNIERGEEKYEWGEEKYGGVTRNMETM